jgi:hypothetical protein
VAAIAEVLGQRTFRMAMKYASGRKRAAEGVAAMKGEAFVISRRTWDRCPALHGAAENAKGGRERKPNEA